MKSNVIGGARDHHMPDVFFVEYAASVFRNMSWMNTGKMVSSRHWLINSKCWMDDAKQLYTSKNNLGEGETSDYRDYKGTL